MWTQVYGNHYIRFYNPLKLLLYLAWSANLSSVDLRQEITLPDLKIDKKLRFLSVHRFPGHFRIINLSEIECNMSVIVKDIRLNANR